MTEPTKTMNLTPDILGLITFLKAMYAEGQQVTARRILLTGWRLRGTDVDAVLTGTMTIIEAVAAAEVVYLKRIAPKAEEMDHDGTEDLNDRRNQRPHEFES